MKRSLVSACFALILVAGGVLAPRPLAAQGTVDGSADPPLELARFAQQGSQPLAPGMPTGFGAVGGAGTAGVWLEVPRAAGGAIVPQDFGWALVPPGVGGALVPRDVGGAPLELSEPLAATPPTAGPHSYLAVGDSGYDPAYPDIAAGPDGLFVAYNRGFVIYDKSNPGNRLSGSTWYDWFRYAPLGLPADTDYHSPRAIYDFINHRLVIVVLANTRDAQGYPDKAWYVVVSSQSDGVIHGYWVHVFDALLNGSTPASNYPVAPAIGADGKNLYIAANMYNHGHFVYAKIRMLKLDELVQETVDSGWYDLWDIQHGDGTAATSLVPAHHYVAPDPMYFISAENNLATDSGNILGTFRITLPVHNNWPAVLPTLSPAMHAVTSKVFQAPPAARQLGTSTPIDTGDTRILSARQYGGHLWAVQTCTDPVPNPDVSALCLYGLNTSDGSLFFEQSGYGDKTHDYFAPALALDKSENLVVVFSRSGPDEYISARYAGMKNGEMGLSSSRVLKSGLAPFDDYRWGLHGAIERDPLNNELFFMAHQYASVKIGTQSRWGIWVGSAWYPEEFVYLPAVLR
jgi:hypothetical protein